MVVTDILNAVPADLTPGDDLNLKLTNPGNAILVADGSQGNELDITDDQIRSHIISSKLALQTERHTKKLLWDECWSLYRGKDTWDDKEAWQSKIVMPKAWNSVKQATNAMMRMLQAAEMPWTIEPINPDDEVSRFRSEQLTDLTRLFLQNSDFFRAVSEGLEGSFITGLGIWKVWWGFKERPKMVVRPNAQGGRDIVRQIISEGNLFIRAVDPYHFYWLKGSRFGNWIGTIEDIEINSSQLFDLEAKGVIPEGSVEKIRGSKSIDEQESKRGMRFDEPVGNRGSKGPKGGGEIIKLTDYYGPIFNEQGRTLEAQAHVLIANDSEVIIAKKNKLWTQQPPYVAFSPLLLPFRQEGVGLIEHTIDVDKAFNRIINMTTDKQLLGLIPALEVDVDLLESPEQLDTGLVPGKIIRIEAGASGASAIRPIIQDTNISPAAQLLLATLDRGHQEGSLISEIQQSLPRFRGNQTAEEIGIKQGNQVDFLSAMSKDIDEFALKPIIEAGLDLVMQFLDTSNDPRVGSILGVGQEYLRGLDRFQLLEMIQGDYIVKVSGVTDQVQKREALGEVVQLMNIIGQNAEAWMPFVNQTELLKRVLEGFPGLRDTSNLVETPEQVEAKREALRHSQLTPEILRVMPQIIKLAAEQNRLDAQASEGQPSPGGVQKFAEQVAPQVQQTLEQQQQQAQQQQAQAEELRDLEYRAYIAQLKRVISGEQDKVKPVGAR